MEMDSTSGSVDNVTTIFSATYCCLFIEKYEPI